MKGASGYIGAGKIHYACYYICDACTKEDFNRTIKYYPLIVEAVIEFLRYSRELIAGVRNQEYKESPSARNIPLLENYNLVFHARHDKYYCLK